jgi:uncharacterized protein YhaN
MMRLREFSLDLFGHFSGKTFDFGKPEAGQSDFHVIYGPNEAGKTTTMEAFLRLLYGFPHRDSYDFMHQRKNLQVSGILEVDGTPMRFSRLPVRTGSLRDHNDTALPEAALSSHLGGLSEEDYRQLLCLDDETIEKGGHEIVSSNGDIGRLLFSAAAGVSDLSGVLDQFRSKADGLYRKRASSTEMARLKKELAEVERKIKDLDIPASTYRKLKQALELSQAEEDAVRIERSAMHQKKAILEAHKAALPKLAEIDTLEANLLLFANYPKRLDFNPEELVQLLTRQTKLLADKTRIGEEIADLRGKLDSVQRQPDQLTLLEELERLDALRSRYATADIDLEKRRTTLKEIEGDMTRAAQDLQAAPGTDAATLTITPAQISQLEQARERTRDVAHELAIQRKEISDVKPRLEDAELKLNQNSAIEYQKAVIGPILNRYSVDVLAPQYASAKEALRTAAATHSDALSALTYKGQTFDAVPDCAADAGEVEALADRHNGLAGRREKLADSCDDIRRENEALKQRIAHLKKASGLVDDEGVSAATIERDQLWEAHKKSLSDTTAETFEGAMQAVDRMAETRLGHATELGQLRHEEQRLLEQQARLAFDAEKIASLDKDIADIEAAVATQANSASLRGSVTPTAFAEWITKLNLAKLAAGAWARLKEEHDSTISAVNRLIVELRAELSLETDTFETVLAEARKRETEERAATDKRQEATNVRNALKAEMDRRQTALDVLQGEAEAREADWLSLVGELFGDAIDASNLKHSLEPLRTLRELEVRRMTADRQVMAMETDQTNFASEIAKLGGTAGLEATLPPLEAFKLLADQGKAARAAEDRFETLSEALATNEQDQEKVEGDLLTLAHQVSDLARLFPDNVPTATLQELRSAVSDAQGAIENRVRLDQLVSTIRTDLATPDLDAARAKLHGATLSDLSASLLTVNEDLEAMEGRYRTAIEMRTSAQRDLSSVTGDADVAALTERKATLEVEIEDVALAFLEKDFGLRLAEEAIRRYRDSHRSSMMQGTEKAFSELTNGAYTRLITRPEGASEILLALDKVGMAKQASDMSKGTRFQLYLALRAAAYEQLATQGICLPFFCDDIFETFDEERTQSACRVMERIGKTGQAIYLTHHRHVVEIAKSVCSGSVVVHEL